MTDVAPTTPASTRWTRWTRWTWLGDHLALDFANTVRVTAGRRQELVGSPNELASWLAAEPAHLDAPVPDAGLVRDVRALRDATLEVLHAAAAGHPLPSAIAHVNAAALAAGAVRVLSTEPGASDVVMASTDRRTAFLGRLAAAVIDLVARDDLAGLAVCPAPSCGQFFHRARPNQRWCSPGCGNRARVDRHRHRRTGD